MKFQDIKILAVGVISLAMFSSCESYLLEANPNKVTSESYWKDLGATKSTIYAAYAGLREPEVLNIRYESVRCDLSWPGYGRPLPQNNAVGWTWYTQVYNGADDNISKKWNFTYTIIWRANQAIEALESLKGVDGIDMEEWTLQMAQARYVRGLSYFFLHSAFNNGSVVLSASTPANSSEFNRGLAPAEDVLKFFRDDLQFAIDNLPDVSAEQGLPSKAAAVTTLATSYMYTHELDLAKPLFEDVINNTAYGIKLETDLDKMFTANGEFNSESIFEIPYSAELRTDIGDWDAGRMVNALGMFTSNGNASFLTAWLAGAYLEEAMDPKNPANFVDGVQRVVPLRASTLNAFVIDQYTPYYMTGNAADYGNNMAGGPLGEWGFGKFKQFSNYDIWTKETARSGKNITVSRLSDVMLMYAECLLDKDDVQGALDMINQIRRRWGLVLMGTGSDASVTYDGVSYSKQEVMDHIMYSERPLELSIEGCQIRWQDLKRWGLLEEDDKNIFKRHAAEVLYAVSPTNLKSLTGDDLPTAKYTKHNTITSVEPAAGEDFIVIDYEYDDAAKNYNVKDHQYFPIPSTEITNNSEI